MAFSLGLNPCGPGCFPDARTLFFELLAGPLLANPWYTSGYRVALSTEFLDSTPEPVVGVQDVSVAFYGFILPPARSAAAFFEGAAVGGTLKSGAAATAERSAIVTEKGLNIVRSHLAQFGDDAGNAGMIQRLESQVGKRVFGADRNFYMHELKESTLMKRGLLTDEEAHWAAFRWDRANPFSVYHPDVVRANPTIFSPGYLEYWDSIIPR